MNIDCATTVFVGMLHAALGNEVTRLHRAGLLSTAHPPLLEALNHKGERRFADRRVGRAFLALYRNGDPQGFHVSDPTERRNLLHIVSTTMQIEWDDASVARQAIAIGRAERERLGLVDRLKAFQGLMGRLRPQ